MNNAIPEAPQTIPTIVPIDISNPGPNKGLIGIPIYPSDGFSDVPALIAACQSDRSPLLPANFELEVGIVRLFRQSSYRDEIAVVKGCGCVTLQTPIIVESFVGSQNHSFAFYTGKHCEKEPFYQRFNQHYDIDPNKVVNSIRIFQGVLPPLPSSDTLQ
ncbi:hypothetical protein FBU30_002945 [Linnemannia zychae]|nr:hypothetical protein FBU30_002945 [Linnemannia zychae]